MLFRWEGRASRKTYWICGLIPASCWVLGAHVITQESLAFFFLLLTIYMGLMLGIKRSHDLDYTGFFALLLFVPCVQLWPLVMLGFIRGTEGDNKYGKPDTSFPTLFKS
jgi:uncharacterized membrane protein YhaH (DUF805 family)